MPKSYKYLNLFDRFGYGSSKKCIYQIVKNRLSQGRVNSQCLQVSSLKDRMYVKNLVFLSIYPLDNLPQATRNIDILIPE